MLKQRLLDSGSGLPSSLVLFCTDPQTSKTAPVTVSSPDPFPTHTSLKDLRALIEQESLLVQPFVFLVHGAEVPLHLEREILFFNKSASEVAIRLLPVNRERSSHASEVNLSTYKPLGDVPNDSDEESKQLQPPLLTRKISATDHLVDMFLAPGAPPTSVPSPTEQALDRVFVGFQMLENMAKDQLSQKSLLQDDQGKSIMHKKQDGREEEMKFIESFGTSVASGITSKQVIVMTKDGKFKKLGDVFQAVEYVGSLPKSWESVRWIDVQGQNYQNIAALGCELSLHPLTVDDCVETTRQKLEPFQKYLFMVLESLHHVYYFKSVDNPLRIVFTSGYVVTFHEHPLYMINCHFERTLKKLFSTAFGNSLDSFDLFHTLLSSMITTDEKAVMKIEAEVGAMEDVIYQETMKSREGFLQVFLILLAWSNSV
jgi:Mg2+ and Co2+ transporter CorA